MPFFGLRGTRYVGSIQCGAGRDAFLEVAFSDSHVEVVRCHALPRMKHSLSDGVAPNLIVEAAKKGADKAFEDFGLRLYVKELWYLPNDSRHYDIHGRVVWEIIRHIHQGGEFRDVGDSDRLPP